jgi:uncharacterized membrane protein YqgA involved in biofilm formation
MLLFPSGPGLRVLTICLAVGAVGVVLQQRLGESLDGGSVAVFGLALVVPLAGAVWGLRKRGHMDWSAVIYGSAAGAVQILAMFLPLVFTSLIHPNPKYLLSKILLYGVIATVLSTVLGSIVGLLVQVLGAKYRSTEFVEAENGELEAIE